ncbi:beta-2-glycoprotein 1 [Spea bombifrons]|uniref:beta-2-glycoprotein 1 n=1 Tax=Spea bombifrons TaxID=233779 RepID=UPI00234AC2FB|nr:beta-2-glycoprotein 1 [Spea bombifrons]
MLLRLLCGLCLLNSVTGQKLCSRPREVDFAVYKPLKIFYEFRDSVSYACSPGYEKVSGKDRALCLMAGNWEHATITCQRKQCPNPGVLPKGQVRYRELSYGSHIHFACNEGYNLHGANESRCTESGTWSPEVPACKPITCPPPPVPNFGRLVLYTPREGNTSQYLDNVTYGCLPKYAMFGNASAYCTANGTWSRTPDCRDVKCRRPTEIEHGFLTYSPPRLYDYQEAVTYGCKPTYVLDGPKNSFCDKNGEWTVKPSCRAPCHVTTKKATVLYNGRKTRVDKISDQLIQHGDIVTYFCKDDKGDCAHSRDSMCLDGHFTVPPCYKDPGLFSFFSTAPHKLPPCATANATLATPPL